MCLCLLWLLIKLRASDCRRRRRTTKVYFYGQSPYTETERKTPTRNNGQLLSAKIHFGPKTREKRSNNRRGAQATATKLAKFFHFTSILQSSVPLLQRIVKRNPMTQGKSRAEQSGKQTPRNSPKSVRDMCENLILTVKRITADMWQ